LLLRIPFSSSPSDSTMDPVNPFNILKLLQSDYEQHFQLSDPPSEFDRMLKTFIKGTVNFHRYIAILKHVS
ncbi:hypothetical protein RvY_07858, partial [Ramazzottius varieornatus]